MFEELMSDEMKELMEKIEELMQELEKEGTLEMMEEMEGLFFINLYLNILKKHPLNIH